MTTPMFRAGWYRCVTCGRQSLLNAFFLSQIEHYYLGPDKWPTDMACWNKAKGRRGDARRQAGRMVFVKEA